MTESYTACAGQAVLAAATGEPDFGGWLAHVLAAAAAELGCTDALTAGRAGSWEADLVQRLVKGTVGWDDEYLADHKTLATMAERGAEPEPAPHRGSAASRSSRPTRSS